MKKYLLILCFFLLFINNANSDNIVDELTKLNELYKKGVINESEFSKAKSILLNQSEDLLNSDSVEALIDKLLETTEENSQNYKSKIDEEKNNLNNNINETTILPGLTLSEEDELKAQIFSCWSIPLGLPSNENLLVRIKVYLKPDGTVLKTEILDHARMNMPGQGFYKVLAESALRAVKLCQPLRVPSTGYERWKELQLNFDAREMLGG